MTPHSLIGDVIKNEFFWVPVILFLLTQVLKVFFARSDMISSTVKELLLTLGTELCVLGLSIHLAVITTKSDTNFARVCREELGGDTSKIALAAGLMVIVYAFFTILSFGLLKEATRLQGVPVDSFLKRMGHMIRVSLLIGLSLSFGVASLVLAVWSVWRVI